jgi:hypothetical protein
VDTAADTTADAVAATAANTATTATATGGATGADAASSSGSSKAQQPPPAVNMGAILHAEDTIPAPFAAVGRAGAAATDAQAAVLKAGTDHKIKQIAQQVKDDPHISSDSKLQVLARLMGLK